MVPTLNDEEQKLALASLARFSTDELELELSDIQLRSLLSYFLKEISPSVYNQGVADSQRFVQERLADLGATCYAPEFSYWPKGSVRRK